MRDVVRKIIKVEGLARDAFKTRANFSAAKQKHTI